MGHVVKTILNGIGCGFVVFKIDGIVTESFEISVYVHLPNNSSEPFLVEHRWPDRLWQWEPTSMAGALASFITYGSSGNVTSGNAVAGLQDGSEILGCLKFRKIHCKDVKRMLFDCRIFLHPYRVRCNLIANYAHLFSIYNCLPKIFLETAVKRSDPGIDGP